MINEKNKKYNGCYVWLVAGSMTPTGPSRKDTVDGYEIWAKNGGFPEERILTSTLALNEVNLEGVSEPYKTAIEMYRDELKSNFRSDEK